MERWKGKRKSNASKDESRRKKVSKNKEEKMKEVAHIKCHSCDELGHLASGYPNKLEKKAQANNEKQHMS